MGIPRRGSMRVKIKPVPLQPTPAQWSNGVAPHRGAARSKAPGPRTEWTSFVLHCVRSWLAAGASTSGFLSSWHPVGLVAARPSRPERARRRASIALHRGARRPPHRPDAAAALLALPTPWDAAALRSRYPLVSALLAELAATHNVAAPDLRSQRRG